jgi:hypothetical protein
MKTLTLFALLVGTTGVAAAPPPFPPADARYDDLERRVSALEKAVKPADTPTGGPATKSKVAGCTCYDGCGCNRYNYGEGCGCGMGKSKSNGVSASAPTAAVGTSPKLNCGEKSCPALGGTGPCSCGDFCPCRPSGMKAGGSGLTMVKGYWNGEACWMPEGYTFAGWTTSSPAGYIGQGYGGAVYSQPPAFGNVFGGGLFRGMRSSGGGSCGPGGCR